MGELYLARGDPAKAQEFADQCLKLATHTNSRKYVVKGWQTLWTPVGVIVARKRQAVVRTEAVNSIPLPTEEQ